MASSAASVRSAIVSALLAAIAIGSAAAQGLADFSAPREREALRAIREGRFVRARVLAEEILAADPDSAAGQYVLGTALQEAEGTSARALVHFARARELLEVADGVARPGSEDFYFEVLYRQMTALSDLGRYEDLLDVTRVMRNYFDGDLIAIDAWPLMKLGRIEEARRVAARAITTGDPYEEAQARNVLCALDGYEECRKMLERVREAGLHPGLALRNTAMAAILVGRHDEAERLLLESIDNPHPDINAWRDLADLYLLEGRLAEALDASRNMVAYGKKLSRRQRQNSQAEEAITSAQVLLFSGHADRAHEVLVRALREPDRASHWSGSQDEIMSEGVLLDRIVRRTLAQHAREIAALSGWLEAAWWRARARWLDAESWMASRRALRVLVEGGLRPRRAGRDYDRPELNGSYWLLLESVSLLGPGPTRAILADLRAGLDEDPDAPVPRPLRQAEIDAFETEAAWWASDERGCLEAGTRALEGLPAGERMLMLRLAARMADAAYRLGDAGRAWRLYDRVLTADPGMLRRLALPLPVGLAGAPSPALDAARWLLGSPRFVRDDASPYRLAARGARLCLETDSGAQLACATDPGPLAEGSGEREAAPSARAPSGESEAFRLPDPRSWADPRARLAHALLEAAFSPRVDLSQADLRTLDGSTTVQRGLDRKALEGLVDPVR